MDFTTIMSHQFGILLTQFWYLIPLLLLVTVVRTPWFKGKVGEWFFNFCIKYLLDKRVYHLIPNVTLPTGEGTTQIDHLIVSCFGVFVVETKNYKGWIFGNEKQKTWTQQIYRSKHRFQNPLHQNYKHVMTLKSLTGLGDHQVHSLIYFIGNSTFKTPMPENVLDHGLIPYIKSKTAQVLNPGQISNVIESVQQNRLKESWKTDRAHVAHLQSKHNAAWDNQPTTHAAPASCSAENIRRQVDDVPVCSRCGNEMILRTVSRGEKKGEQFWGCSSYPKCRNILAMEQPLNRDLSM